MAAKEKGVKVLVCHVLRYAPKFMRIKEILDIINKIQENPQMYKVG